MPDFDLKEVAKKTVELGGGTECKSDPTRLVEDCTSADMCDYGRLWARRRGWWRGMVKPKLGGGMSP